MKENYKIFETFLLVILITGILSAGCGVSRKNNSVSGDINVQTDKAEKVVLTYGYIDAYSHQDMPDNIKERIVTFNQSQDEYFIEIIKYGEDSYKDGLNALNAVGGSFVL